MTDKKTLRQKISKLGKEQLEKKYAAGKFQGEELEVAKEILTKRGFQFPITIEESSHSQSTFNLNDAINAVVGNVEVISSDFEPLPEVKDQNTETIKTSKPKKIKPVKKSGKREKKVYIDEKGKELTKSDLMRRLIRLTPTIKPRELNEQLIDAGFQKAYHSEIQRCREQMGVTAPGKVRQEEE